MAVKFVVSSASIEALLQSASISEAMVSEAESLRAAAAAAAPNRVEAVSATVKTRRNGSSLRAVGRVVNDAPHAVPIEFGHFARDGHRVPGHHTLGKLAGSKRARRGGRS